MGADQRAGLEPAHEDAVYCARHPDVETYLRCGKCGTPICPRCLIQTPVGARCPDCTRFARLPTLDVTPVFYLRGLGAALVSGALVGVTWALVTGGARLGLFFAVLIGLAVGWAVSEAVTRATNHKRGPALQLCAVLGVVMAYLLQENLTPGGISFDQPILTQGDLIAALIAAAFAISRLRRYQ